MIQARVDMRGQGTDIGVGYRVSGIGDRGSGRPAEFDVGLVLRRARYHEIDNPHPGPAHRRCLRVSPDPAGVARQASCARNLSAAKAVEIEPPEPHLRQDSGHPAPRF
jgi:hypothetical protein